MLPETYLILYKQRNKKLLVTVLKLSFVKFKKVYFKKLNGEEKEAIH